MVSHLEESDQINNMKRIVIPLILVFLILLAGVFALTLYLLPALKPIITRTPSDIADLIEQSRRAGQGDLRVTGENRTNLPLDIPDGFDLDIFARDLGKVRVIINGPGGGLMASVIDQGRVIALPDVDQDGRADKVFVVLEDLNNPHGLVLMCEGDDCRLFVAEPNAVSVYDLNPKTLKAENREKIIDLPDDGGHFTRTLMRATIGGEEKLLISVGSSCNVCEEEDWRRAKILVANLDGTGLRTYASGLRNSVFMTTHPVTGEVWATDNGRDWLGDDLPPDEINIIREGEDYGWPICYGRNIHDTDFDKNQYIRNPCEDKTKSIIDLDAHVAPLGIAFIPEEGWGEEYWYNALVAYHGSWNSSTPVGYKVVRLLLDEEGNIQGMRDFISGWLTEDNQALGRPVDILIQPGGLIYVSDDKAGVIYRMVNLGFQSEDNITGDQSPDITLDDNLSSTYVSSPLTIQGEARGFWFFEADFPVELRDESDKVIATGIAQALDEWMTKAHVPFALTLEFSPPATENGTIVFKKDNPSGLPQFAEEFKVPVRFRETTAFAGEECEVDQDCLTPPEFAIRSSCPYEALCLENKCTVVCPDF